MLEQMVWDMPVTKHGKQMEHGSLEPAARRRLTDAEIPWNAELIEAEGLQQRTSSVPSWFMGVHHSPCLRAPIATVAAAAILHCYSDSIQHARDLCERWPNLRIGFTGADTFRDPSGKAKGKGKGGSGSGSGHGHGRGLAEVLAPSTGAVLA